MKFRTPIKNQDGIALLVVVSITTVLVALVVALHKKMDSTLDASLSLYRQTTLSQMTTSGIHIAMAILVKDRMETEADSIQEDWADPEFISEAMTEFSFDEGEVSVVISDERSRIQVNAIVSLPGHEFNPNQEHLWIRLLELMANNYEALEEINYNELIEPLKDWIDSGENESITGLNGAESSYYMDLEPPYECRNAPLDHLGDLARIKGFPPALFSDSAIFSMMSDIFTVHGASGVSDTEYTYDGKININTADVTVLSAILPDGYETYAQDMIDYRTESDAEGYLNELASSTWYKDIPGLEDVEINSDIITNTSDLFRITATATLSGAVQTTVAVVQREAIEKTGNWRCKVLYWESK
jgi:general secretion pathway protein K